MNVNINTIAHTGSLDLPHVDDLTQSLLQADTFSYQRKINNFWDLVAVPAHWSTSSYYFVDLQDNLGSSAADPIVEIAKGHIRADLHVPVLHITYVFDDDWTLTVLHFLDNLVSPVMIWDFTCHKLGE